MRGWNGGGARAGLPPRGRRRGCRARRHAAGRVLPLLLLVLLPLSGCQEPPPCVDDATLAAAFAAGRARLADLYGPAAVLHLEGSLEEPFDLFVAVDLEHERFHVLGTRAGERVDVRADGALRSIVRGSSGHVERDHRPGPVNQGLFASQVPATLPFAPAPVDAYAWECVQRGDQELVAFLREVGNERDGLLVERAPPYGLVQAQHVSAEGSWALRVSPAAPMAPVDDTLPRRPASLVLEQVDYQEDDQAFAFRWVVGAGSSWVPADDVDLVLLGPGGNITASWPLVGGSPDGNASHRFQDHDPAGILEPGDVLSVAAARDHQVTFRDEWAGAYADVRFVEPATPGAPGP